MATVRYIVNDVDASLPFYRDHLGFREVMHPAPPFAMLARDDLRLVLVSPIDASNPGGGSRPMADGTRQEPGGWNRFALEVDDLEATVARLRAAGVAFRAGIITGIGGKQALAQDPSGNLVELFQPVLPEARERSAFGQDQQH
ncbi:MAG: VOC family protein [Actinobacteria bacterium]|nr:VOC family protein [Actinomycetota bacterium]